MEKQVIKLYEDGNGIRKISLELKISVSRVRAILKNASVHIRTKSESQRILVEKGLYKPPMLGKKHNTFSKQDISKKMAKVWDNMDSTKRKSLVDKHKENWNNLLPDEKKDKIKIGQDAIRQAAKTGSKMELLVLEWLKEEYGAIHHKTGHLHNEKLEVDIFLPVEKIAVEVDGISHYDPIWGHEMYQRCIELDNAKNGLLIDKGVKVLRITNRIKSYSKFRLHRAKTQILDAVKHIIKTQDKYTEIEVV